MKKKKKKILLLVICLHKFGISIIENSKLEEVFTNFNFMFIKLSNSKSKQFESYQWIPELLIKSIFNISTKSSFFHSPHIS